jgi:hypothetical protein
VLVGLTALLSAAGHLAGGGELPDLGLLAVLLPLLAWPVVAVAERCRSTRALVLVLGTGQLVVHQVLTALHAGHHDHDAPVSGGLAMLTMHAAATALTTAALRHADRGVAALGAALGRVVPRRLSPPPVVRPLAVAPPVDPAVPARTVRVLATTQVRRGPPVRC